MDHHTMLTHILKPPLGWHLARVKCLSALIIALFKVKTVNLTELATAFGGRAQSDSTYRRLQRFFQYVDIPPELIARLVMAFLPDAPFTLALDRSNWMLGSVPINFLVLSIVHQGVAFPLVWNCLSKQGNSNTTERMALLDQFVDLFGTDQVESLLADREFIGKEWFGYLLSKPIPFHIRIKSNMNLARTNGTLAPAQNFFRSLPLGTFCTLMGPRLVCRHLLWVTGRRLASGEYVILLSNNKPEEAMATYKQRWKLEVLFQSLKSRGFRLEETHLTEAKRLKTLLSVLTLAFCWAYHIGAWRHTVKPIRINKHHRPAKSLFRYGFDWIRQALNHLDDKHEHLTHVLTLLENVFTGSKAHIHPSYET
jgi:hypothetical protein